MCSWDESQGLSYGDGCSLMSGGVIGRALVALELSELNRGSIGADSCCCSSSTPTSGKYSSVSSCSSSSSVSLVRPLVMQYTPKKVSAHPPTNFPTRSAVAASNSRYRTALPIMTDRVKRTNCVGITCVESKRWSARFRYRIWRIAVPIRMKARR